MTKQDSPALILVDMQKGFDDVAYWGGHRNNPAAEMNAGKLLHFWRENNLPIFHVKHCSANPNSRLAEGNIGNDFKSEVRPNAGEVIIKKNVIAVFLCIELMLNAVNLSFVAFSSFLGQVQGQVIVFLVMVVAAAEAAVGLAITVALFRNRNTLSIDETDLMKW